MTNTDTAAAVSRTEQIALGVDTAEAAGVSKTEQIALGIDDAAVAAGVSRSTIYRWLDHGGLPYRLIGGRRFVIVDELRAWLAGQPRGAT